MSIKVQTLVWESDLPRDEKYLILTLADFGNDDGVGIYPSLDYIAWRTGYSMTQVVEILKKCRGKGYVTWQRYASHVGTNQYRIFAKNFPERPPWQPKKRGRPETWDSVEKTLPVSGNDLGEGKGKSLPVSEKSLPETGNDPLVDPLAIRESGAAAPVSPDPDLTDQGIPLSEESGGSGVATPEEKPNGGGAAAQPYIPDIGRVPPPVELIPYSGVQNPGALAALERGLEEHQDDVLRGIDVADFPEDTRPVVRMFCREWGHRPPGKKSKDFGFWIEGARDVKSACGEFGSSALKRTRQAFESYMEHHQGLPPYTVSSPASVVKAVIATAAMMRLEKQDHQKGAAFGKH